MKRLTGTLAAASEAGSPIILPSTACLEAGSALDSGGRGAAFDLPMEHINPTVLPGDFDQAGKLAQLTGPPGAEITKQRIWISRFDYRSLQRR